MSINEFDFIGQTDMDLHVSLTQGPSEPPTVNVYAISTRGAGAQFVLRLDLPHVHALLDSLTLCCETIEADMAAAAQGPLQ